MVRKTYQRIATKTPTSTHADQWSSLSEDEQQAYLLHYRMTYLAESEVNWCPELGTVLANDEVVNGVLNEEAILSNKKMKQWMMRISSYAERLLNGLDTIDWPEPLKEMQRNWIGRSVGATVRLQSTITMRKLKSLHTS
ncbi:MAG: hypothetical protein CM15mP59_1190 [Flavobacteriaceae bacterium]|nr:MAG: hypothetical protein CM15mP59_1190 [Flavobacteriaceae bacterium]